MERVCSFMAQGCRFFFSRNCRVMKAQLSGSSHLPACCPCPGETQWKWGVILACALRPERVAHAVIVWSHYESLWHSIFYFSSLLCLLREPQLKGQQPLGLLCSLIFYQLEYATCLGAALHLNITWTISSRVILIKLSPDPAAVVASA